MAFKLSKLFHFPPFFFRTLILTLSACASLIPDFKCLQELIIFDYQIFIIP